MFLVDITAISGIEAISLIIIPGKETKNSVLNPGMGYMTIE